MPLLLPVFPPTVLTSPPKALPCSHILLMKANLTDTNSRTWLSPLPPSSTSLPSAVRVHRLTKTGVCCECWADGWLGCICCCCFAGCAVVAAFPTRNARAYLSLRTQNMHILRPSRHRKYKKKQQHQRGSRRQQCDAVVRSWRRQSLGWASERTQNTKNYNMGGWDVVEWAECGAAAGDVCLDWRRKGNSSPALVRFGCVVSDAVFKCVDAGRRMWCAWSGEEQVGRTGRKSGWYNYEAAAKNNNTLWGSVAETTDEVMWCAKLTPRARSLIDMRQANLGPFGFGSGWRRRDGSTPTTLGGLVLHTTRTHTNVRFFIHARTHR